MEIRRIDSTRLTFRDTIELADVALDAFRDDPLYLALNMHYGHKHYRRVRLSYALLLAAKLWRRDVRAWVAVKDERAIGFCRWEKLPESDSGVSRIWIWVADVARWLVDVYASIVEPPQARPVRGREAEDYFADVADYFAEVAPLPEPTAYLGLLCSRESYKGQGVGSSLLRQSMRELSDSSAAPLRFSLWSTAAGLGLYKKVGFQVRAERNSYLNGQKQRQILMLK